MAGVRRVADFAARLASETGGTPELAHAARQAEADTKAALFDDLNAPEAMATLFSFITAANREFDRHGQDAGALQEARRVFAMINGVLDIVPDVVGTDDALAAWVEERLAARAAARTARDVARADAIRKEIEAKGVVLEDTPAGTRWKTGP